MNGIEKRYEFAREQYAALGVDTDAALQRLEKEAISIHAWQGDDVVGFEPQEHSLTGGCQVTGNYPGRARTADELRADLDKAMTLLAGNLRVNLQAHEVDRMLPGQDRDALTIENGTIEAADDAVYQQAMELWGTGMCRVTMKLKNGFRLADMVYAPVPEVFQVYGYYAITEPFFE